MGFPVGSDSWIYDRWGWLGLFGAALVLMLAIFVAGEALKAKPWEGTTEDQVKSYGDEHCEVVNTKSFVVQQANFWSNLAYLAVGLIVFLRNDTYVGRGVGVALAFLFLGSALWHGSLTTLGRFLDIMGVYMALMAIGFYGFIEVNEIDQSRPNVRASFWFVMAIGVFAGLTKGIFFWHKADYGAPFLGGCLFALMIWGVIRARQNRTETDCCKNWRQWLMPGIWAVMSLGWASFFKFADGEGKALCQHGRPVFGPDSIIQGHALWHVLSAFMMLSLIEFFTSLRGKWGSVWPWRG